MEISLNVLVIINVALLFLLLMLFSFLIIRKTKEQKRKARIDNIRDKLKGPLFQYLNSGNEIKTRLFQRDPISYEVVQQLLFEYKQTIKGDEVNNRIQAFAEEHFSSYYSEQLGNRNWSVRMNTLYSIEDFQITSLKEAVWERFINSSFHDSVEKHQQIRVLAKLQSEKLSEFLIADNKLLPLFLYKEVLRNFNTKLFDQVISRYDEANEILKIAILAIFAEKKDTSYLALVERELENGHTDIRIQALKVLHSFGYITNLNVIVTFANSSLWQERMLFCKIASVVKKERFKQLLVALIGDESWWVRNAAGEAISFYEDGDVILNHLYKTSEDPFARDMAMQWLGGSENVQS